MLKHTWTLKIEKCVVCTLHYFLTRMNMANAKLTKQQKPKFSWAAIFGIYLVVLFMVFEFFISVKENLNNIQISSWVFFSSGTERLNISAYITYRIDWRRLKIEHSDERVSFFFLFFLEKWHDRIEYMRWRKWSDFEMHQHKLCLSEFFFFSCFFSVLKLPSVLIGFYFIIYFSVAFYRFKYD